MIHAFFLDFARFAATFILALFDIGFWTGPDDRSVRIACLFSSFFFSIALCLSSCLLRLGIIVASVIRKRPLRPALADKMLCVPAIAELDNVTHFDGMRAT